MKARVSYDIESRTDGTRYIRRAVYSQEGELRVIPSADLRLFILASQAENNVDLAKLLKTLGYDHIGDGQYHKMVFYKDT
jgi:hypothetical protein